MWMIFDVLFIEVPFVPQFIRNIWKFLGNFLVKSESWAHWWDPDNMQNVQKYSRNSQSIFTNITKLFHHSSKKKTKGKSKSKQFLADLTTKWTFDQILLSEDLFEHENLTGNVDTVNESVEKNKWEWVSRRRKFSIFTKQWESIKFA